ncbi:ABC transporter permease [Fervidobacterium thailandense]|uniref:Branched-chain amino acid ABC transporter permease n=1 Tax=Fervidobacterium thailandense TaxID=1008305 RepID=A0A1E3G2Z0_9BACT|nr:ABC transporter permease [Fervidobacterium thailandense]ODN30635.1 branched-chain amino acid ABC transporter permease [Fervidobacterium thailandense]
MRVLQAVLSIFVNPQFYKIALTVATPLIFASLGGVFSEITGVVNIALEGIILMGAFTSVVFTYLTGNVWFGVLMAVVAGLLMALLHAWGSIKWAGNQVVLGTALILLSQGITGFLMEPIFGQPGQTDFVGKIDEITIPGLVKVPFIGQVIGEISPFVYIAFGCVAFGWWLIYKTKLGLRMRAVGENPEAADTLGVNVYAIRYFGVLMSGVFASLAGAYLSVGEIGQFKELMSGGRGFIGLAAMIVGKWNPVGAMLASLFFGFFGAFANQLQSLQQIQVPANVKPLFDTIPFILTIIVVAGVVGRSRPPKADGVPYEKSA